MVIFYSYVSLPEGMTSISSMKLLVRQYALVVAVAVATVVFCQSEVQRFMFDLCWLVLFWGAKLMTILTWLHNHVTCMYIYIYTIMLISHDDSSTILSLHIYIYIYISLYILYHDDHDLIVRSERMQTHQPGTCQTDGFTASWLRFMISPGGWGVL